MKDREKAVADEGNDGGDDDDNEREGGKGPKSNTSNTNIREGPAIEDTVSWDWGNGQPQEKVLDVKDKHATIATTRGNEISCKGNRRDPAVILDTGKSKAMKLNHELNA